MPKKELELIQVLRGIASLLVVLLHVSLNSMMILQKEFFGKAFHFGGSGVDIFFVLSGFIITYTSMASLSESRNSVTFLRRRFVRIYPVYWLIISVFLLLQVCLPSFYRTHFAITLPNILFTYLLLPGHEMINGVSWTLSFELFFYLLFTMAFFIRNKKISFGLGFLYSLVIIGFALGGWDENPENSWLQMITFPMNLEFFMGVVVAALVRKTMPVKTCKMLLIVGSVLFLVGGIMTNYGYVLVSSVFNRVILSGIPAFFIILGLVKLELHRRSITVNKFLLKLGESSYSLYLLHLPVVVATLKIIQLMGIRNSLIIHFILILLVAGICYGSIIFFRFVEKPLIDRLNKKDRKKKPVMVSP